MHIFSPEELTVADRQFKHLQYNDPTSTDNTPLVHLIGAATDPFEANSLAYKMIAGGELLTKGMLVNEKEKGTISFGTRVPFEENTIQVDILNELADKTLIGVRCLATDERLYKEEYGFWEAIAPSPQTKKLIFAYQSNLHPIDEAFLGKMVELYPTVELLLVPVPTHEQHG
jgi:hypothetical protein